MSQPFATVEDIQTLWRPLTADEQARSEALLPLVSDEIRVLGQNVGKDIDKAIELDPTYGSVVKIVTCVQNTQTEHSGRGYDTGVSVWSWVFMERIICCPRWRNCKCNHD